MSDQSGLEHPVIIPVEAYISEEYAIKERDRLWRKVWLQAGRIEDVSDIGSYISFEIKDDSVIVVRTSENQLKAFHNVCPHRGRRLVDIPQGKRNASGRKNTFVCAFHGWTFNKDGDNIHVPHVEDWQGQIESCNSLTPVKIDTWGGWIWINLDPESETLQEFLGVLPDMLDPFELDKMRVRWRKWGVFDCNWKVAMEAFNETYHVATTHPEFNQYGAFRGWSKVHGKHSNIGYEAPKDMDKNQQAKLRVGSGADPRIATAEMQRYTWEKANTNTTQTLVDAAQRLVDELPEGTPAGEVLVHWLTQARKDDEARGVFWPTVSPDHVGKSGTAWQIFPNFQIGHAVNNMLCYSARPFGDDPNKCIFEAAVYQLYPEGQAPETEWQFSPATEEAWCYVLAQDFSNMAAVQKGLQSFGFSGAKVNPYMERSTANLHRNLAEYMGTGSPVPLQDKLK
jgi:phenylpropionate dioxygenase-like ring-hydroxylating dioxygenase large terminal subunit